MSSTKAFIMSCIVSSIFGSMSSTVAMYVSCGVSFDFAIVIRPLRDKWYGVHSLICPCIFSFIFSKLMSRFFSCESMVKPCIV